ncbi:MAG: AMIN domain-containing protein [Pseudomonadota bacterium]
MRRTVKKIERARIFLIGVWVCLLSFPAVVTAGDGGNIISQIKVEQVKKETNVIIEGTYQSYRAFSLENPARLVIDFDGTGLGEKAPTSIDINGPTISQIRIGRGDNRIRVVMDSSNVKEPFHYNIGKKEGYLRVKCWAPGGAGTDMAKVRGAGTGAEQMYKPVFPHKELNEILGIGKEEQVEKQESKKVLKYVGAKIQTIDFYQEDLHNVFRLFGEITGKNFIVDDTVKGTLTLSLRDVPWDLAMDIIADMKNLSQQERDGILVIKPKEAKKTAGELIVKPFEEKDLYPAKIKQKEQKEEAEARELILKAHNLEKEGRIDEALGLYEEAFSLSKKNIELVKKMAYLHYTLEHFARSWFFAKEALKLNTQDAESALYAALSSSQLGKKGEATLFFEAAVHSKPELPEAFLNYGIFLEQIGKYPNALYIHQRYEEIFGPSLEVGLAIARIYEVDQKRGEACKKYHEISFSGFSMDQATETLIKQKIQSLCGQGG